MEPTEQQLQKHVDTCKKEECKLCQNLYRESKFGLNDIVFSEV